MPILTHLDANMIQETHLGFKIDATMTSWVFLAETNDVEDTNMILNNVLHHYSYY